MSTDNTWQPLLTGEEKEQTWKAILDIAQALPNWQSPEEKFNIGTVAGGSGGICLFYSYLAQVTDDEAWADLAGRYLDESFESLANAPLMPSLHSGFSGIGWLANHLEGSLIEADEEEEEDSTAELDQAILTLVGQENWQGDYDLISGLAGFGVYALEGLPKPSAVATLKALVDRFEELATDDPPGLSWFTAPHLIPPHQLELCPEGYFNLGLAHGIPAVLVVLAGIHKARIEQERVAKLLSGGVDWLLDKELEDGGAGCYASWHAAGLESTAARAAWCYGDPGVAASLLLTARWAGNKTWEREALRIGRIAAARPLETSGIRDAGLCHGSAGLGHIYNRFHQASGDQAFADAARFWFRHTLDLRQPGEGIAGFLSWAPDPKDMEKLGFRPEEGFLTGVTGVALAMLAAVSDVLPEWDRVLMVNVPPI